MPSAVAWPSGSDVRVLLLLAGLIGSMQSATTDEVALEYRVKAAYLYNFVKFVEWPKEARPGPLTICVASRNPFGTALSDTIRGELVNGRELLTRVILEPDPDCHVLFIPNGSPSAYLRAARGTPILTVGETPDFLEQGGIIGFVTAGRNVRFAISTESAEHAKLRVSARLLQLAINTRSAR